MKVDEKNLLISVLEHQTCITEKGSNGIMTVEMTVSMEEWEKIKKSEEWHRVLEGKAGAKEEVQEDFILRLYRMIGEMTVKRVEEEKATIISERTLKMIALTQSLFNSSKI